MSQCDVGRITRVPLREVWPHEALDFTCWLQENIEVLNLALGLELENPEREQSAGSLNVDIVAEDPQGNSVVIENQLERSDHDHLGKLVTYVSMFQAKLAIWIVAEPRPEHIQAVSWLNEALTTSFYLVKLEAIKIGESSPAPLLTKIVGPSQETKDVGMAKKDVAERYLLRHRFWSSLLERAKNKTKLHANISPSQYSWIGTGAGKAGLSYNYWVRKTDSTVELYIDKGKDSEEENQKIFDQIFQHRVQIEEIFGDSLEWERLDGKRACRIKKTLAAGGYRSEEDQWPTIHDELIESMIRLEAALSPVVNQLSL